MKKLFSIFILIFGLFAFNTFVSGGLNIIKSVGAIENTQQETTETTEATVIPTGDDILEQPVFQDEKKPTKAKKITNKISSIITKILAAVLLVILAIICFSFIWISNLQRKQKNRKKNSSIDSNVINAVDNFSRHRIK